MLDRTLRLVIGTWEGDRLSFSSGMLKGIARIIHVYGDRLQDEMFKEHVGKITAKNIARTARDRRAGTLGFAEAMVLAYNSKNKYALPMQNLYWNGKKKAEAEEE